MMTGSLTEPKKHLALDTDWTSAVAAVCGFFIFSFLSVGKIWMTLRGPLPVPKVGWLTPVVAGMYIYFGIGLKERLFKTACFVVAIGPVSRILLWLVRASPETQLVNAVFVTWIDIALYLGACTYIVYWFKTKVRHV